MYYRFVAKSLLGYIKLYLCKAQLLMKIKICYTPFSLGETFATAHRNKLSSETSRIFLLFLYSCTLPEFYCLVIGTNDFANESQLPNTFYQFSVCFSLFLSWIFRNKSQEVNFISLPTNKSETNKNGLL